MDLINPAPVVHERKQTVKVGVLNACRIAWLVARIVKCHFSISHRLCRDVNQWIQMMRVHENP